MEGSARDAGKRLLVLGAGAAQLGLLEAAARRALFVIAADRDPGAPGFRFADRRAVVSSEDEPAIQRLAVAERIDAVIAPGTDWPVGIAARTAHRLGLPHPVDPDTATLATSKLRQRERFVAAGVPHARWRLCSDAEVEIGFPCVVKAPDRQGQRGLSLVRSRAELGPAVERAVAASRTGVCLIEELVDGPEVTVIAFSRQGVFHPLAVTDRVTAEPPAFGVALAHVWPSATNSSNSLLQAYEGAREIGKALPGPSASNSLLLSHPAVGVAERAAEALEIREGPTYTQLRIGRGGPSVVELAARLGGGHDAELVEAAVGVPLNDLALSAALGEEIEAEQLEPRPRVGGACTQFLVSPPGILRSVDGAERAAEAEGVMLVRIYRRPGDEIPPLRHGADRAGAVLAVGDTREEAAARARRAADSVRFETDAARRVETGDAA